MKRWFIIGGIAVVVAVGVAFAVHTILDSPNNADLPGGVDYLCQNASCKHEFKMTVEQVAEHNKTKFGQPIACPKCGKADVARGVECPTCNRIYAQQRTGPCPYCDPAGAKAAAKQRR